MSLLSRDITKGGIISRSVRDAGIVGFKLDCQIVAGLLFHEVYDHNPQLSVPDFYPITSLDLVYPILMKWRNHSHLIQQTPVATPADLLGVGPPISPYGFTFENIVGGGGTGFQHIWSESLSRDGAAANWFVYPGRFSYKAGDAYNRGFLFKHKIKLTAFDPTLETNDLAFGVVSLPVSTFPDAWDAYEQFCTVTMYGGLGAGGGFLVQKQNQIPPEVAPTSYTDLDLSDTIADGDVVEFAALVKDGRIGLFVNGVEVKGPTVDLTGDFDTFGNAAYVMPYFMWRGFAGTEQISFQQTQFYRLQHVNTEVTVPGGCELWAADWPAAVIEGGGGPA